MECMHEESSQRASMLFSAAVPSSRCAVLQMHDPSSLRRTPARRPWALRVQAARPSVAHITTLKSGVPGSPLLALNPDAMRPGSGSGFIWDDRHIVTNFHVIQGASHVKATLSNQSTYPANVVGTDENNDIAVLKLETSPLDVCPIQVGTSHDLMVGQRVFAIGNPFGLDQTLTGAVYSRSSCASNTELILRALGRHLLLT
jgi:S1-C subfamily serine protease